MNAQKNKHKIRKYQGSDKRAEHKLTQLTVAYTKVKILEVNETKTFHKAKKKVCQ